MTIAPPSCIPGPTCIQATGTASIATDYGVLSIQITNPGSGYSQSNPPTVVIAGGGGSGATGVATIGAAGSYEGQVYLLTSLAVTPSGARAMAQQEVAVNYNEFTLGPGGALTLLGSNPSFGTPFSMPFQMIGTDCPKAHALPAALEVSAIAIRPCRRAAARLPHRPWMPSVFTTRRMPPTPAPSRQSSALSLNPTTTLAPTRLLTCISGNYSWNGVILVIGTGASVMSGGGNGQINGTVYVANTSGGTLSSPVANWSGGGGNGIQYDHCWADLLNNVPKVPVVNASALQVRSLRTEVY